ncbi:MAG: hypothetical protein VKL59_22975 [Nostocaceae cyanobacterium]|nr:hypothetical protein [Nostocaceae cyanobacterium]
MKILQYLAKGLKSTVGHTESQACGQNNLYLGGETPRSQVGWLKQESHALLAVGVSTKHVTLEIVIARDVPAERLYD